MAWKRGVANNQAGEIRKGQIKEFQLPSSRKRGISIRLFVSNLEDYAIDAFFGSYLESPVALFNSSDESLESLADGEILYLHAHEHPRCVLSSLRCSGLPPNTILLNESQRVNSKVCTGENELWTIYRGESFVFDARSGAIGDTELRVSTKPIPVLQRLQLDLRLQKSTDSSRYDIDGKRLAVHLGKIFFHCVVTLEELLKFTWEGMQMVCRVADLTPEEENEGIRADEDEGVTLPDNYRGVVDASTEVVLVSVNRSVSLSSNDTSCRQPQSLRNIVLVKTRDEEIFPCRRRLLRPCIALTSVVQAGRGIYQQCSQYVKVESNVHIGGDNANLGEEERFDVEVDVDACTFDRVLLYLEHEARGEMFKFDPLIATELLEAALTLQVRGLEDVCRKVLGSFEERVRKTPIRLEEVLERNKKGRLASLSTTGTKYGETILILSGMVKSFKIVDPVFFVLFLLLMIKYSKINIIAGV
jgi:hypothetical protein